VPTDATAVVIRQHEELWSQGNLEIVDELFAPSFVGRHPGADDWIGPAGVRQAVGNVRRAFPDFVETVIDVVEEGSKVVTRFVASGTHRGPYRGVSPTGKRIAVEEVGIFRIDGGKIVEKWGLIDRLGMFAQLGVPPTPGPQTAFLYEIVMDAELHDLGVTPAGHRRIVVVTGGRFEGPALRGQVLAGGGDWLVERADGTRALDVRITLRTDDGDLIYAHYPGLFYGAPDVLSRLLAGEAVESSEYYFRTAPFFETGSPKYAWLNRTMAIGIGRRTRTQVAYSVYAVL
jgi:steroid delta-isomerase-like uncharacterized protein